MFKDADKWKKGVKKYVKKLNKIVVLSLFNYYVQMHTKVKKEKKRK